nr:EOG090X04O4 [Macrothrix elegans]
MNTSGIHQLSYFIVATIVIAQKNCKIQKQFSPDNFITQSSRLLDEEPVYTKIACQEVLEQKYDTKYQYFVLIVPRKAAENLSFFKAQVADSKDSKEALKSLSRVENGLLVYKIQLQNPLEAGQTVKILVGTVFTHSLRPYPAEISQKEKQLVQYHGSAYIFSSYKVSSQTTKILLSSSNVESFTKLKKSSSSESTVTYGPYENIAPLTEEPIVVHFENNSPFLSVSNLVRHIEVSHWGNIAVEETIDIYHSGAKLKGSFSRFEYQREQSGVSSIKNFRTVLPEFASDVYYRDEIGNISTSNLRQEDDGEFSLELRPRFPLFGGWQTHYVVGYNLPSFANLFNSGDQYVLQMDFISHLFDNMVVDEALVRIILPEGASDIQIETPYSVTRLPDSLHYTYLDTKGRPVIQMSAKNLVENHIQDFKLSYKFSRSHLLQEPLLCVSAFFLLFLSFIVYARLDFSITKDEGNEKRLRSTQIKEIIREYYLKRASFYQDFSDQLNKLRTSRDLSNFQAVYRNFLNELKALRLELPAGLKPDYPAFADRVSELQKFDKSYRELQINHAQMLERLMAGKMGKPQYIEAEAIFAKKKEIVTERLLHQIHTL